MNKRRIILISILTSVILVLILIATFFDLQISMALSSLKIGEYYTTNLFAIIFEIIGETFLYLFLAFAGSGLFWWFTRFQKSYIKTIFQILFTIVIFVAFFFFLSRMVGYVAHFQPLVTGLYFNVIYIFLSVILTFLIIFSMSRIKEDTLKKLFVFSLIIICTAVLSNLITQVIKGEVFGRMRYRAMNYIGDFSFFTPWYYINGDSIATQVDLFSDAFKSFPSGHITACGISFSLMILPYLFEMLNTSKWKIILTITPLIITILVALARIIAGAHFLSDTIFGALITFGATMLFSYIFIFRKHKKLKQQEN